MFHKKNLPMWERIARVLAGAGIAGFGLLGLSGQPVGYLLAASGVFTGLTGFVGFCPMCWMAGRRLILKKVG